jgi:hypothetical protein
VRNLRAIHRLRAAAEREALTINPVLCKNT